MRGSSFQPAGLLRRGIKEEVRVDRFQVRLNLTGCTQMFSVAEICRAATGASQLSRWLFRDFHG